MRRGNRYREVRLLEVAKEIRSRTGNRIQVL